MPNHTNVFLDVYCALHHRDDLMAVNKNVGLYFGVVERICGTHYCFDEESDTHHLYLSLTSGVLSWVMWMKLLSVVGS